MSQDMETLAILNPYIDFDDLYDQWRRGELGEGQVAWESLLTKWSSRTGRPIRSDAVVNVPQEVNCDELGEDS